MAVAPHDPRLSDFSTAVPPDVVFGVYRAKSATRRFRLRRFVVGPDEARDFVELGRRSLKRLDLQLNVVTGRAEGQFLRRLVEDSRLIENDPPADLLTEGTRGLPVAIVVPIVVGGTSLALLFPVIDSLRVELGQTRLSFYADAERVRDTYLASEDERAWQINETLVAIYVAGPPTQVLIEAGVADPSLLAELFNELDPDGREAAGRDIAERAVLALSSVDSGSLRFSDQAAARLAARSSSSLGFASRLEHAHASERWQRLTKQRLQDVLGAGNGVRWGVPASQVIDRGQTLELDVSETTAVRILRDAFATSELNREDVIEGEGRPMENPLILG